MQVFELVIPADRGLTNFDLARYIDILNVPNFRGVFMRDELPPQVNKSLECGIMNFNRSDEVGSHWVCYVKNRGTRIYFDSFGQITPIEMQKYLKTAKEFKHNRAVIQRNTDIVQSPNTHVCGHLCLVVLTALMREHLPYQQVLNSLHDGYTQDHW